MRSTAVMPPTLRPIHPDETQDVMRFITDVDRALNDGYSESDDQLFIWLQGIDGFSLEKNTFLAVDAGVIRGAAIAWRRPGDGVVYGFATIDPSTDHGAVAPPLFEAVRARGVDLGDPDGEVLRVFIDINDESSKELLERSGFVFTRRSVTMLLDLVDADAPTELPPSIGLRRAESLEDAPLAYELIEDTFAEHWGHVPQTYEQWTREHIAGRHVDPTLWFFVFEGDEPVAVMTCREMGGDGWVDTLGVRKPWRGRGIAKVLLGVAFAEFRARGFERVGLAVDTGNSTGAFDLYKSVGMRIARGDDAYEARLEDLRQSIV